MQYLKEDVKARILNAALLEFKEKGYLDASMRVIAHNSGMALGSIYRYFKNKQQLFDCLIEPVYLQSMSFITDIQKVDSNNRQAENSCQMAGTISFEINEIKNKILEICKEHYTELLILMDKSKGSRYETVKTDLITIISDILTGNLLLQSNDSSSDSTGASLIFILSSTFVEGLCLILRKFEDGDTIKKYIDQLINIFFKDIAQRMSF